MIYVTYRGIGPCNFLNAVFDNVCMLSYIDLGVGQYFFFFLMFVDECIVKQRHFIKKEIPGYIIYLQLGIYV